MPEVFERACTSFADSTAIVDHDRRITYRQMRDWANTPPTVSLRWASRRVIASGCFCPPSWSSSPTQHGIWKAGAVLVQMPTRASAATQLVNLRQVRATALNPAGKLDKKALRAPFWAGRERQVG